MVSLRLATPAQRRVTRSKHVEYADQRARRIGEALLRLIEGSTAFQKDYHYFTRETLLQHFGDTSMFSRVSTYYRYVLICSGVTYLLSIGALEKPKVHTHHLCLPRRAAMAMKLLDPKIPLNKRYFGVIKDTVMYALQNEISGVDTLIVTDIWHRRGTSPDALTKDELRVLVRRVLREMVRQDTLIEHPDYSYTLKV